MARTFPPRHPSNSRTTEANTSSSVLPATRVLSCKGSAENRKGTKESGGEEPAEEGVVSTGCSFGFRPRESIFS